MHVGNQMVSGNTLQTNMAATQTVIVKVKYINSKIACAQTAPPFKTKSERNDLRERILSDFVLREGVVCAQAIQRVVIHSENCKVEIPVDITAQKKKL